MTEHHRESVLKLISTIWDIMGKGAKKAWGTAKAIGKPALTQVKGFSRKAVEKLKPGPIPIPGTLRRKVRLQPPRQRVVGGSEEAQFWSYLEMIQASTRISDLYRGVRAVFGEGLVTGRMSSAAPSLQELPRDVQLGPGPIRNYLVQATAADAAMSTLRLDAEALRDYIRDIPRGPLRIEEFQQETPVSLGSSVYRGVYDRTRTYEIGDMVTMPDGSMHLHTMRSIPGFGDEPAPETVGSSDAVRNYSTTLIGIDPAFPGDDRSIVAQVDDNGDLVPGTSRLVPHTRGGGPTLEPGEAIISYSPPVVSDATYEIRGVRQVATSSPSAVETAAVFNVPDLVRRFTGGPGAYRVFLPPGAEMRLGRANDPRPRIIFPETAMDYPDNDNTLVIEDWMFHEGHAGLVQHIRDFRTGRSQRVLRSVRRDGGEIVLTVPRHTDVMPLPSPGLVSFVFPSLPPHNVERRLEVQLYRYEGAAEIQEAIDRFLRRPPAYRTETHRISNDHHVVTVPEGTEWERDIRRRSWVFHFPNDTNLDVPYHIIEDGLDELQRGIDHAVLNLMIDQGWVMPPTRRERTRVNPFGDALFNVGVSAASASESLRRAAQAIEALKPPPHPETGAVIKPPRLRRSVVGIEVSDVRQANGTVARQAPKLEDNGYVPNRLKSISKKE